MERYRLSESDRAMLEGLPMPFAVFQLVDQRIVTLGVSQGFCDLLGASSHAQAYADMDGNTFTHVHPDDIDRVHSAVLRFVRDGGTLETIYRLRAADGAGYRVLHAVGRHEYPAPGVRLGYIWYMDEGPYMDRDGRPGSGLNQTLTNALHEESILRASRYDSLTDLPAMTYFFELAEAGKAAIDAQGKKAALLFMDLGGMKFYNKKHGFAEGDNLLRSFAGLLGRTFDTQRCCRIGTDHFAAFTPDDGLEDRLRGFFAAWQEMYGENALPVHVGVYSSRIEDVPVSTACDRGKIACDALRGVYASAFNFYSMDMRESLENRQYILDSLDRAIAEGWIRVYYQPIVRALNGRVCDEEALARWIDPEKGMLSPGDFIPVLEDAGLISRLDLYILEKTLEKMHRQAEAGLCIVPHSINLSRADFENCDIVEEIRRRVDAAGTERRLITIEITESMIGSDFDFMKKQVARFQALGFPVWMDDFGSGYSSLDVLQSISFDLIKFDMSFMQRLDEGEGGKIILTELMRMANALGVDTVCEGVETAEQVRFLREIGCSKLQGYYYCKPIPPETILERYRAGTQIGFENPDEAPYYEGIGRVNLFDLSMIDTENERSFQHVFNTLPMGVLEVRENGADYVRTNQAYRDFIRRFFPGYTPDTLANGPHSIGYGLTFINAVRQCCEERGRAFFDEQMPDGSVVHSFLRRLGRNPVTGKTAVAVIILSINEPDDGTTYSNIARALAADYCNIYVVNLETDQYIEYTSPVGEAELAMERHGEDFFESSKRASYRVYEEDRETFYAAFSKEKIIQALDKQGLFTATYRLMDTGEPVYVNMKITRMQPGGKYIIMGVSIIDSQMKEQARLEKMQKERDTLARVVALTDGYLALYTVNPENDSYYRYTASGEYASLGLLREGKDFFADSRSDGERAICPDDLPMFRAAFTRENVLRDVREKGAFTLQYRLMINGEPRKVSLRIAAFHEGEAERLVVGLRAWRERK